MSIIVTRERSNDRWRARYREVSGNEVVAYGETAVGANINLLEKLSIRVHLDGPQNPPTRKDFNPPICINLAQLSAMRRFATATTGKQYIYSVQGNDILVGNDKTSEDDGVWMTKEGMNNHG